MSEETAELLFLIWSNEHGSWWKPNSNGYTAAKSEAGIYSVAEAASICLKANRYLKPGALPNEMMVPV